MILVWQCVETELEVIELIKEAIELHIDSIENSGDIYQ